MTSNRENAAEIAERVRANFLPCLIGAGLLGYFGFAWLSEPTGTGLFERANWILYHAIRFGAVGMAAAAASSLSGHWGALLVDAAVSCPLGIVFLLCGPAMLIDGGEPLNGVLTTVFGGMFVSDGIRNLRSFRAFDANARRAAARREESPAAPTARPVGSRPAPTLDRIGVGAARSGVAPGPSDPRPMAPASSVSPPTVRSGPSDLEPPATGGYLAAFARKPADGPPSDGGSTGNKA